MVQHSSRYGWERCFDVHQEDTYDVALIQLGMRSIDHDGCSIDGRPFLTAAKLVVAEQCSSLSLVGQELFDYFLYDILHAGKQRDRLEQFQHHIIILSWFSNRHPAHTFSEGWLMTCVARYFC
jgi:hypothetical protein